MSLLQKLVNTKYLILLNIDRMTNNCSYSYFLRKDMFVVSNIHSGAGSSTGYETRRFGRRNVLMTHSLFGSHTAYLCHRC